VENNIFIFSAQGSERQAPIWAKRVNVAKSGVKISLNPSINRIFSKDRAFRENYRELSRGDLRTPESIDQKGRIKEEKDSSHRVSLITNSLTERLTSKGISLISGL